MSTENTKSPLKQDKKYNRQTYTGLGTGMQDRLIKGAYLSARADAPDYSWMNAIGSGIEAFKGEMDTKAANKKADREKIIAGIQANVDAIYETGGSLPQRYFDQAYTYTEKLRADYIAAVESGDTKAQHQIKGKLNAFSTSIQNTKTTLTTGGELWKSDMLIDESGMTPYQLSVSHSINEKGAELDMETGTYKWKAIDKDGKPVLDEDGQQKYYTEEDYAKALPLRDDVSTKAYKDSNATILTAREQWLNGDGAEFDNKIQRDANIKIIENSMSPPPKGVGSMQSMIHSDITGQGSFASTLEKHPQFENLFNSMNTKDGLPNATIIGLYDKDGSNSIGYEDFISEEDYIKFEKYDEDGNGVISKEELAKAMEDPSVLKNIQELVKPKIKDAILNQDNDNYNEDLTKGLLADFMTNRQSQMFYGQHDGKADNRYKELIPTGEDGARVVFTPATKDEKGKLIIDGQEIESLEAYQAIGGSYKYLKERGYYWDPKDGGWLLNKGAQFYNADPMTTTSTTDNGVPSRTD